MTPIYLKECAWDKDNMTLTIPVGLFKPHHWGPGSSFIIKSHVTDKEYVFMGGTSKEYYIDNGSINFWITIPEDPTCPINKLYIMSSYSWGQGRVFRPSRSVRLVSEV